ncbi:hypothetical protein F511_03368 [Dorcoceras hygrometricum]|uniref:CAP-Gly domain-containing protein n=1 Tax=Dorcoceras hygrometricum TaxID=472368 RepID=A0A2Z7BFI4_9LAMI|nr:hypothetical protein F511_03368 [Dorcoceras hygrometricum]
MQNSSETVFKVDQRVHYAAQPQKTGVVKYVGPLDGYSGDWVGVDWDADGNGRHNGSHNGVAYFTARGHDTASFLRPHNLSAGVSLLEALQTRYQTASTKEEEDEMYVLSARNNRVSVQLLGKEKIQDKMSRFGDLTSVSLSYLGVRFPGSPDHVRSVLPNLKELDLTGNLIDKWEPAASTVVQGFHSLRLLNLENNCIASWDEIKKLSQLNSLEQLILSNNELNHIRYPDCGAYTDFKSLRGLLLASNKIEDLESIDSLNSFPSLMEVRLSGNPIADLGEGGIPRFVFIARLSKIKIFNGSEISPRERKDSEIRYVRMVMSKCRGSPDETRKLHPRFAELKSTHGIEDEKQSIGASGNQKMASGLISISLKCIGASMGEKPILVKKLPATTTVGKLKNLCESFFKLKSVRPILFLQEEGSPVPTLLNDDMESLMELGIGNESTILVDEEP